MGPLKERNGLCSKVRGIFVNGMFITFEGIEGSGKSTQIHRLEKRLNEIGIPLLVSREPGGTELGRELRQLLLQKHQSGKEWCFESELLLFYADRLQHIHELIEPALAEGRVVLVDRFEDSTQAYQGASGVSDLLLGGLRELLLKGFQPDLTLLLDMEPEVALRRVAFRNAGQEGFSEKRFDEESLAFHRRVWTRFRGIAAQEPGRVMICNADQSPDLLETQIWQIVSRRLIHAGFEVGHV